MSTPEHDRATREARIQHGAWLNRPFREPDPLEDEVVEYEWKPSHRWAWWLILPFILGLLVGWATKGWAEPVGLTGSAWLSADCGWAATLALAPGPFQPTCPGSVSASISTTAPQLPLTLLSFIVVEDPGLPTQHELSREARLIRGGDTEIFDMGQPDGLLWLIFALPTEAHVYQVTLLPALAPSPPAHAPEPATLLLLGGGLVVVGWVARRRGYACATTSRAS